ncbi:MAG: hypothetical protein ACR2RL_20830 [Gammaproteobacteria bacterium]
MGAAEIESLFQGRTVDGYHERHEYHFQSFYEADGTFRSYQGAARKLRPGRWWLNGDLICIRWDDAPGDLCRLMVRRGDKYVKVLPDRKNRVVVTFVKFTDGNPYGL